MRPDLVLILTDHLPADAPACYGSDIVELPDSNFCSRGNVYSIGFSYIEYHSDFLIINRNARSMPEISWILKEDPIKTSAQRAVVLIKVVLHGNVWAN